MAWRWTRAVGLTLVVGAMGLSGCGRVAGPVGVASGATAVEAQAKLSKDLAEALAKFSQEEGRKVTAHRVPMNGGRGACELKVPLPQEDAQLLLQLYRLHARNLDPKEYPAGLVERSKRHLETLYRFTFKGASLGKLVETDMRTRCYRDGEGKLLAYETWLPQDSYQLFAKYDLQGRIMKVDIETWSADRKR